MPDKSIDKLSGLGFAMPDANLEQAIQEAEVLKEEISSRQAVEKYGMMAVADAYSALAERIMKNGVAATDPVYQHIMASDNPYDDLVQWHRKEKAKARKPPQRKARRLP